MREDRIRILICLLFLFGVISTMSGQRVENIFSFRNYNSSLSLSVKGSVFNKYISDEYGKPIIAQSSFAFATDRYLYQSQEYDGLLNTLFFPLRLYSLASNRFLMPDPQSQYFSPYIFVGGDPVNYVDRDGAEGKPLVLYGIDHSLPEGKDLSTVDIMGQVSDAHYVPITDFVNGKVPDLTEWNGNVFLDVHLREDAINIELERGRNPSEFTTGERSFTRKWFKPKLGEYEVTLDSGRFGEMLREFSEQRGVPIQNITTSACQGGEAAERMGFGYVEARPSTAENELKVAGLKKGRFALIDGEKSTEYGDLYIGRKGTRFSVSKYRDYDKLYMDSKPVEGQTKEQFVSFSEEDEAGVISELPHSQPEELEGILNGRVPQSLEKEFSTALFEY